jgi:hypothetical protein
MGFFKDLVREIAQSPGNETVTKFDPFADAVTNTLTESTETGWGKPLGGEKSGLDVIGGRFTNELWRGYGGDPDEARDRRVGRTVGSLFAGSYLYGGGGSGGSGLFSSGGSSSSSSAAGGSMWESIISNVAPSVISLIGSGMQAKGSDDASKHQLEGTREAIAEQRRQYDTTRADFAPYREIGRSSLGAIGGGLGLPGYDAGDQTGFLTRRFAMSDFENDPVVKASLRYGLEQGTKGVDRAFGARGMLKSGSAIKALERFAADYAGTQAAGSQQRFVADQSNLFNRLAATSGIGQAATTTTAQLGANAATNIGNLNVDAGNARGAASIARANAYTGALSSIGNNLQQRYYMGNYGSNVNNAPASDPYVYGSQNYYNLGEF